MPHKDADQRRAYQREYQRRWKAAHPESVSKTRKQWKDDHPGYYARKAREFRERNPNYAKDYARQHRQRSRDLMLAKRYGLTQEQVDAMVAQQGGICAICGGPPGTKGFHIDHDHTTGEVRGLLCGSCNVGVGWLEGWYQRFGLRARDYLLP